MAQSVEFPCIPLEKLNCRHCLVWGKDDCGGGILYKNLDKTGESYCLHIWSYYSTTEVERETKKNDSHSSSC